MISLWELFFVFVQRKWGQMGNKDFVLITNIYCFFLSIVKSVALDILIYTFIYAPLIQMKKRSLRIFILFLSLLTQQGSQHSSYTLHIQDIERKIKTI